MYLLDTNVISEMRKSTARRADPAVQSWTDRTDIRLFYLSAVTILELEKGVLQRSRKDSAQGTVLHRWLHQQVIPAFHDRIFAIDTTIALRCAALHVPATAAYYDALIAATALVHNMTVVTRNTADFASTGVSVLNPWLA